MRFVNRLSIRSKLIAILLAVSIGAICAVGTSGYTGGAAALTRISFNQLTSLRAQKARQIEAYFEGVRDQVATLGENLMVAAAVQELAEAFRQLDERDVPEAWDEKIDAYYRQEMLPRLAENAGGRPLLEHYRPKTAAARYLQYHYLVANPYPVGERHLLDRSEDASDYNGLHARYHPILRNLVERFGYYDLFLIDLESGSIVYSVYKEADFATNLTRGPYLYSNLAVAVAAVRRSPRPGAVRMVDYAAYEPSYGVPAAFIAGPIFDGARAVGVVALQLPVDEINRVMTGDRRWREDGLGESGETYLVGQDYLMRSESRFLIEDPEGYLTAMGAVGVSERRLARLERLGTAILQQEVRTGAAREALAGSVGTEVVKDYRGVPVLSSYSPLSITGVRWALLSEIDLAEARAPIHAFGRRWLVSSAVAVFVVTLAAIGLANLFVSPIRKLTDGARAVGGGDTEILVDLDSQDEVGELAKEFNVMLGKLRAQTRLVEAKNRENEDLLKSIFPAPVAARLQRGEERIADSFPAVTVMFADIVGFTALSARFGVDQAIDLLSDLVTAMDEVAEEHGVEKVKTFGSVYMAAAGLFVPRLDHGRSMVDFALELLSVLRQFNRERETALDLAMGLDSGPVYAGIVGRSRYVYDLWGGVVNTASQVQEAAEPGEIVVTSNVHEGLADLYPFQAGGLELRGKGRLEVWRLVADRSAEA